eukprot:SAG11_NODE_21198_length_429_cov_17.815152_1_plen_69_part_10
MAGKVINHPGENLPPSGVQDEEEPMDALSEHFGQLMQEGGNLSVDIQDTPVIDTEEILCEKVLRPLKNN